MKHLVLIFALIIPHCWATTVYVSVSDGDDARCTGLAPTPYHGKGNQSCPWKTISKINGSSFSPGDTVLFKRGDIWRESLVFPSGGNAERPIMVGAYGASGGQPIISGADLITGWSLKSPPSRDGEGRIYTSPLMVKPKRVWYGSTELTYAPGAKLSLKTNHFDWVSGLLYVKAEGDLNQTRIEATVRAYPLYVRTGYLIVDGIHFTRANEMNIISAHRNTDHVTVQNCTIDYAGMSGIFLYGDTATIGYWTFLHNAITHNGVNSGQDQGVYASSSSNNVFDGNRFENNIGYGIQLQDNSDDNIVRYNYFHANRFGAVAIWDNGKGFPTKNAIFGNVSNRDAVGVMIGGSAATVSNSIVNNTFYGYTSAGLSVQNNAHFGAFKNNIVWSTAPGATAIYDGNGHAGMVSDYNLIGPATANLVRLGGTSYSSLSAYAAATGHDTHSITADPRFRNALAADFSLFNDSPAIRRGATMGAPYNVGLDPRTNFPWGIVNRVTWDIGAFAMSQERTEGQ